MSVVKGIVRPAAVLSVTDVDVKGVKATLVLDDGEIPEVGSLGKKSVPDRILGDKMLFQVGRQDVVGIGQPANHFPALRLFALGVGGKRRDGGNAGEARLFVGHGIFSGVDFVWLRILRIMLI